MHGFVREELPLVCQKCNPAVTRRDPALRGKLLRQKCVSVGAPSCLASLSVSLFLSILLTTSTSHSFFYTPSLYLRIPYIFLSTKVFSSCPFAQHSLFLHRCLPPHSSLPFSLLLEYTPCMLHPASILPRLPPPLLNAPHPPSRFLPCEGAEALLSGDRSPFLFLFFATTEKINKVLP